MFVSMRWLARHVDLEGIRPEQLANDLTLSTAEVEGLERFAPALHDVVVGRVVVVVVGRAVVVVVVGAGTFGRSIFR